MIKNIIIAFLVLTLIYFFLSPKSEDRPEVIPKESREYVDLKVKEVSKSIDEKGFDHAVMEALQNEVRSLRQLNSNSRNEVDSVKKLLKLKDKQLISYTSINTTIRDTVLIPILVGDTSYRYTDKYASIEHVLSKDSSKPGYFNFSYNADVNYAEYWKKKNFLSKKKHYIDFWISDPRATINGIKRVKIEANSPSFKVDVNALGLYFKGLNVGLDGQIKLGRFRVGGGYIYNFDDKSWRPIITGRFNLLEF
ncbi:hypothetical protein [Sphingobacterium sp. LRF_L2]|uniref:hypothetical protein n=1 Tax=Sphingobacterium sp. LRF_L2 TaxID=3369421 RepID=UPI003F63AEAB